MKEATTAVAGPNGAHNNTEVISIDAAPSRQESLDRIQATDRIWKNYLSRRETYHTERRIIKRWTVDEILRFRFKMGRGTLNEETKK